MAETGFNAQNVAALTSPTLTIVEQNMGTTMGAAAEVLWGQFDARARARQIIRMIAPELVIREPTGPARAE